MVFKCICPDPRPLRPWVAVFILILLVLVIPVYGDDSSLAANESDDPDPIEPVLTEETPLPEITPAPEITEVPDPPGEDPTPVDNSGEVGNETAVSGTDGGNVLGAESLPPGDVNQTPDTPPTPEIPTSLPSNLTENITEPQVQGDSNATARMDAVENVTETLDGDLIANESADIHGSVNDTISDCSVNPPWAANLTDPPLNNTNLVDGIGGGKMWEINGSTGSHIYTVELSLDTGSLIGIWIHDVSGVVLDGLGHELSGHGGYGLGAIGILINGTVSDIQVKNFTIINAWDQGIVVQGGDGITLGDNLHTSNNHVVGINVSDAQDVTITGVVSIGNEDEGIRIHNSTNVEISDTEIRTHRGDGDELGLVIMNCTDVTITDNTHVWDNTFGVKIADSQDVKILGDVDISENIYNGLIIRHSDNIRAAKSPDGFLYIYNNGYHGLYLDSTTDAHFNDTIIQNNNAAGLYTWNSGQILLYNVTISETQGGIHSNGMYIQDASGWHHIINSTFLENDGDGIGILDSNLTTVENITIRQSQGSGIVIGKSEEGCYDTTITGTRISNNPEWGIRALGGTRLTVVDSDIDNNGKDGIELYREDSALIQGNTFIENGVSGINVTTSSIGVNITGNHFERNPDSILISDSAHANVSGNTINNDIYGTFPSGISLFNGHGHIVSNNNIRYVDETGILVDHSDDAWVSGNTIRSVPIGILVLSSDGVRVENHVMVVNYNLDTGISGSSTTNMTISGNQLEDRPIGINLNGADNTTIFNNILGNHQNFQDTGSTRTSWNVTPVPGPNIVGGPSIGGNYWSTPANTGWSQTHPDTNGDGFTDLPYTILAGHIDSHPLSIAGEYHPPEPKPTPPGGDSVPVILTPPGGFTWGGSVASETFPDQACVGSSVPVSITVEAGGNSAWLPGTYGLGTYNDAAQSAGSAFVPVNGVDMVSPGSQYTFSFTITAPSTPGTYTFQYRMRKSDGTWFGDVISITLNVVNCGGTKGVVKEFKPGSTPVYSTAYPRPTITPWKNLPG